ncbi:MAG: penicillin-binding protein 2 [Patescibacteria group bacterium]
MSIAFVGLVVFRLFFLQIVSYERYKALAENQHQLEKELTAERGEIFIRDHFSTSPYSVVRNVNRPTIYVAPQQVKDLPELSKIFAKNLGLDQKEILSKIADQSKKYVMMAKEVPEAAAEELQKLNLPGVFFEDQIHQEYPEKQLGSQVLGFVAYDGNLRVGRYGIQHFFEKELAGIPGRLKGVADSVRSWISSGDSDVVLAKNGADLILTIDRAIQFKAEEVLDRAVASHGAKSGSVIVMNPKTGAVLAMANFPTFDPNNFNKVEDTALFNNPAIQTPYEPGSVMKAVTFAAALDAGAIAPDTTYDDPGSVTLENFTVRNAEGKNYGQGVTMTSVLDNSINTGAIFAQQKIGLEKFRKYVENFGFGKSTGISLPFESKGNISNLYKGGELYPATASYGQGITATPLQLVTAYAAIANGGKLYQPYIVEETVREGKSQKTESRQVSEVISQNTASTLSAMLVSVVQNGHGKRAGVPGYFIAGKTGTAQIPYADRAGYDPDRNIGTFIGFGPVDNPAFVMLVKIDEPQDVKFAESTAAPAFGEIAQFILNYYQVPKNQ